MKERRFEWDARKVASNFRKHRVTFEEAKTVWDDPDRLEEYDDQHSIIEDRWLVIGVSVRSRLLSIVYTKRNETTIRIISARRANQAETFRYTGHG